MIVNSLITSVAKYFSTLSVPNMYGISKVALVLEEDVGLRSALLGPLDQNSFLELDATETVTLNMANTPLSHPSESREVYTDSIMRQPNKMVISATVDSTKLMKLQLFASPDKIMYVIHHKNMGGAIPKFGYAGGAKLYSITNLDIMDEGFINTAKVNITLSEVVFYQYERYFKYGYKQSSSGASGNVGGITKEEFEYEPW
ncbi:MAG: hypothetical protein ACRCX2_31930 [Paraclostridium sp.]